VEFDPTRDYPLGARRPELVSTPSGLRQADVTLEALRAGRLGADDLRATADTIRRQAAVALAAGRTQLAENLMRAAELSTVPGEVVLDVYTALRPRRSTASELDALAERLEQQHAAPRTAAFVREALAVYSRRGFLALDERSTTQV
jgi:propanediol dehydratase small subunit